MTREEAIKYLEMWRECYRNSIDSCTAQAIGMAIEALENEADRKTEPQKKEVEWVYNKRERLWYPYSNGELLFKTENSSEKPIKSEIPTGSERSSE